jgi:COMPASS component SWD2
MRFTHLSSSVLYASTKINHDIRYLSTHDNNYISYFKGHEATVTCLTMCPANDEFISCAEDDTLRLWALNTPHAKGILKLKGAYLAAYDPTSSVIAAASSLTNEVLLYDLRNYDKAPFSTFDLREYERRFNRGAERPSWTKLEFSNDGRSILVGTGGVGNYVIDSFEGQLKHFCKRAAPSERRVPDSTLPGRVAGQGDVSFSPDGRYLVGGSGNNDGALVWDLAQREASDNILRPAHTLPFPSGVNDRVEICGYNPRFNQLVTAGQSVIMWYPDSELYAPI